MMDKEKIKWHYRRWPVVFLLLGLGPFAFYNLWKSPEFSKAAKLILTIIVTVLTIIVIAGIAAFYRKFSEVLKNYEGIVNF